jgi:predicted Zn-dependent peptidase
MRETVLDNGVRVLSEHVQGLRSVATGVWVRHGAAHESEELGGASHLLEHLVFKGTRRRTARDLALALESLGGSLDAYTSREHTCFQARVLDRHLPIALDVLSDLVLDPLLRRADLELEREVVLEEIAQVEDTPDDLVFELHGERLWGDHPFGRSILGSADTVATLPVSVIRSLHRRAYRGRNLLVAAAGSVEHDELVERAAALFGAMDPGTGPESVPAPDAPRLGDVRLVRDTAQSHVVFGTALPGHADPARYGLVLLSTALGGGMSSRLFQRVREELGLCYSVYSYQSFYSSGGIGGIYVGTRRAYEDQAIQVIREELSRMAADGLPEDELEQVKQQVKGQVMLSLESTSARLYRLTASALHDEPFLGLDQLLALFDAVSAEQVGGLAERFFHPERQLVMRLGPA